MRTSILGKLTVLSLAVLLSSCRSTPVVYDMLILDGIIVDGSGSPAYEADIAVDQYPYTAGNTGLANVFPTWARAGSREDVQARLDDPETSARIKTDIIKKLNGARAAGDLSRIRIASFKGHPEYSGKSMAEVTLMNVREPTIENGAEVAIHKMTALPASRINLATRGILAEGMVADINIFDFDTVSDNEDWAHPHQYATGFSYVIVGGVPLIEEGVRTATFPGKVLKRTNNG